MSSNHDMMIVMSVTICPSSEDDIHPDVIWTVLSIVASMDFKVEQLDIKTIFLYGYLEEEIYMQ